MTTEALSPMTKPAMAMCLYQTCRAFAREVDPILGDDEDWHCPHCDEPTLNFTLEDIESIVRVYMPWRAVA